MDGGEANVPWETDHEAQPSGHTLQAGEPDETPGLQTQEQCHEPEGQPDLVEEAEDIIDTLLDNLHQQARGEHNEEQDHATLLQHTMDLEHGDVKDDEGEGKLYVLHNVADDPQQGDEVAWVQGRKRKRSDRDPENHTDHGDGKSEVETEDAREECRGPPANAATNMDKEGADVDLEEQRRVENETEEERALQEEFEQDRALHEEWVQKTIDDYFADVEKEQPGPSQLRPGRRQEEGVKRHAEAVTAAFDRWSQGTAAGGGLEIEGDSIREVLTHILNLHPLMAEDGEAPTPHLTLLYQILATWARSKTELVQQDTETVVRIWQGYLEGLRAAMGSSLAETAAPDGRRTDEGGQLRMFNLTEEEEEPEPEDQHEREDQDKGHDENAEQKNDEDLDENENHTTDEEVLELEEGGPQPEPAEQLGRHSIWTAPPGGPPQPTRPRRGARPWPNCLLRPGHRPLKRGETLNYGNFLQEVTEWRRLAALREGQKATLGAAPTSTSMSAMPPSSRHGEPKDPQLEDLPQGGQEGLCDTTMAISTSTPACSTSPKDPQLEDLPQGGQEGLCNTTLATSTSTPASSTSPLGPGAPWNLPTEGLCQGVPDTQSDEPHADDEDQDDASLGEQHK